MTAPTIACPAGAASPLALGGGFLVALSLPPWGWWPLPFVGVALFELALGADARPRRPLRGAASLFGLGWLAMGMGWMWQLTVPGYIVASADLRRASTASPRSVAPTGPLARASAGRPPTRSSRRCASRSRSAACRWPASASPRSAARSPASPGSAA